VINALVALFCAIVLIVRARCWLRLDLTFRVYWLALVAFLLVAVEGSVEQLILGIPAGTRTVLMSVALGWVLFATVYNLTRKDQGKNDRTPR
jgi:hypothetical protein